MTRNNFSLVQLLCTSVFSIFVGMLVVILATVKPHTEAAAATANTFATVSKVQTSITFEVPTVCDVEVIQDSQTEVTTEAAKVAPASNGSTISADEIQRVLEYCNSHKVHLDFAELRTNETPLLVAAK